MECPRCASAEVERLPPSQISPHPGYKCRACGVKMRAPGMLFPYLVVLALGVGLSGLFLYLLLGGEGDQPIRPRVLARGLGSALRRILAHAIDSTGAATGPFRRHVELNALVPNRVAHPAAGELVRSAEACAPRSI